MVAQKIATCCYCGTKAALACVEKTAMNCCGSCGAPLHELKRLPVEPRAKTPKNAPLILGILSEARQKINPRRSPRKRKGSVS